MAIYCKASLVPHSVSSVLITLLHKLFLGVDDLPFGHGKLLWTFGFSVIVKLRRTRVEQ